MGAGVEIIFVEHIRKLTIRFICLFQFRFSNTVTISPLKGWNTLSVFLLTIYVTIEVSGIRFIVPNQLLTYKSCCFLTSAFTSLLSVSNFDYVYYCQSFSLLPVFYIFYESSFLSQGLSQGTEDTVLLVLEGICLSAAS